MQIDFMCAVVEDYIYRLKGVQVRIEADGNANECLPNSNEWK
jgi:hypothetical protein